MKGEHNPGTSVAATRRGPYAPLRVTLDYPIPGTRCWRASYIAGHWHGKPTFASVYVLESEIVSVP